jgi:Na+/melibiose symporter-like transporter
MKSNEAAVCSDHSAFRLSRCTRLAYSVGHVFNDLCASMWFTYLLVFLQRVAHFNHIQSGALLFWGQLIDALCTPVIGYEADRLSCACRYGKRKVWHAIGAVCVLCSFPFVFTRVALAVEASQTQRLIYWAFFIAIFQFGWAATQVAHLALIPQLTPVDAERIELNSHRNAWTVLSNMAVYTLAWLLFSSDDTSRDVTESDFTKLMLSSVILGCLSTAAFHFVVKETDNDVVHDGTLTEAGRRDGPVAVIKVTWRDWLQNPIFYKIALIYTCSRLIVNVSQTYWPMYLTDAMKLAKHYMAAVPLVISASGFFVSIFMRHFITSIGRKTVYLVGLLATMFCCGWLWYLDPSYPHFVFIPAILNGAVGSVLLVTSVSMTTDLIGTNTDTSAFVFGVMSFTDKLSSGVVIALVQQLHPCTNGNQCLESASYYRHVMVVLPTAIAVVCFTIICITASTRVTLQRCLHV